MKGDKVKGALYDTTEAFLFTDSRSSIFRCDYISFPVGSLIMATTNPAKVVGNDRYLHYCRLSTPKLGVFSVLHDAADDHALGEALVRLPLDRRSLWTTQDQLGKIPFPVLSRLASVAGKNRMLADHEEIQADVTVKDFSFNELKLNVNVRGETGRPYLLYYADAYHPFWKAFVNGVESPVIRANIGYKATVIPSGRSEVVFRFGHPFFIISLFCLLLFCLGALIFSGYLFWKDVWLFKGPGI